MLAGEVACDITNAAVTLAPPGPDGLPSATPIALGAPNQTFAGGMSSKPVQTVAWPVEVDPTKLVDPATGKIRTDLVARAASSGTLHDTPNNVHPADISKTSAPR